MAESNGSALSGGLLVILGILVAVGLGYFFMHHDAPSGPSISVTIPKS